MNLFKILTVIFLFFSSSSFSQKFINELDFKKLKFDKKQEEKIRLIKANKVFKEVKIVNIGNIKSLESRQKLPINLPNLKGVIQAERTKLEAKSNEEFIWEGIFPNDEGSIFINGTKDGIYGRINYSNESYSIEAIDKEKSLLILIDPETFTVEECGIANEGKVYIRDEIKAESRMNCSRPIRVGVLFTQNALNTGLDMNNIATTAINDLNTILDNSGVSTTDARFFLAGVQQLQGFNESASIIDDVNNLPTNFDA
jgi:hypothetical protein